MNVVKRAEMVKAMEYIARCVNNEFVFDEWLRLGVADGDLPQKPDDDWGDEYGLGSYIQDKEFGELMSTFLDVMVRANVNGGLYCDGVVSWDDDDESKGD